MIFPVGLGIGPTQLGHVTMSPRRADGLPLIITEVEPIATNPGAAGGHGAIKHGTVMLITVAAGRLLIMTFGDTDITNANGIGGCGTGEGCPVWQCGASCKTLSVIRAAPGIQEAYRKVRSMGQPF